jgi:predicted nucleotidyltransferase
MEPRIQIDKALIADFCRKRHIAQLALFGSVLTDRFGPESDVDVLVEFAPGHVPGLIALSAMERELSGIFGREADMRTPKDLSRYFREQVVRTAQTQYAA